MTLDEFFAGWEEARQIFDVLRAVVEAAGASDLVVTKSQVAFRRRRPFAWAWVPDRYLHGSHAPLVLTISFRHSHPSPRWKQIVEPVPGRFTHHMEIYSVDEIDDEVRACLREAWAAAA